MYFQWSGEVSVRKGTKQTKIRNWGKDQVIEYVKAQNSFINGDNRDIQLFIIPKFLRCTENSEKNMGERESNEN